MHTSSDDDDDEFTPRTPPRHDANANQPPEGGGFVASAYQTVSSLNWSGRLFVLFAGLMFCLLIVNIFTVDYISETKSIMQAAGASQSAIDTIIPPTASDVKNSVVQRENLISQLAANMTVVQAQVASLRSDVARLKAAAAANPPRHQLAV